MAAVSSSAGLLKWKSEFVFVHVLSLDCCSQEHAIVYELQNGMQEIHFSKSLHQSKINHLYSLTWFNIVISLIFKWKLKCRQVSNIKSGDQHLETFNSSCFVVF